MGLPDSAVHGTVRRPNGHGPPRGRKLSAARVACARALVNKPELMFADEPAGNLGSNASAGLLEFLRRSVTEPGQFIVMVTHDPGWWPRPGQPAGRHSWTSWQL